MKRMRRRENEDSYGRIDCSIANLLVLLSLLITFPQITGFSFRRFISRHHNNHWDHTTTLSPSSSSSSILGRGVFPTVFRSTSSINVSSIDNSSGAYGVSSSSSSSSSKGDWKKEAESLRAKAAAVRSEARAMEVELLAKKKSMQQAKISESDDVIDSLFPPSVPPPSPHKLAVQLKEERWSAQVIYMVVDRIFERQLIAVGKKIPENKELDFSVGARANRIIQVNGAEFDRLENALDILQEAAAMLDFEVLKEDQEEQAQQNKTNTVAASINISALRQRRGWNGQMESGIIAQRIALETEWMRLSKEKFRNRMLAAEINNDVPTTTNRTTIIADTLAPMWVPASFLPYIISSGKSTLGPEQVEHLEANVLRGSQFYVTSSDSIPGAAIFRGNLCTRSGTMMENVTSRETSLAFEEIQDRLRNEGLGNAVQFFFLPDPEWRFQRNEVQQGPKPVLLALSKSVSPDMSSTRGNLLPMTKVFPSIAKSIAYALAVFGVFGYSISTYALNPSFFVAIVHCGNAKVLAGRCIPIFLGIAGIQAMHEAGHYIVAKRLGLRIGKPVPIFSTGLGLYGCITPLQSFPPNRSSLLDFALSGPFAGIFASLVCIFAGIAMTTRASTTALSTFPFFTAAKLKSSFLVGSILSCVASKTVMLPAAQPVPIHPLFAVGYSGLIASALNLLPIFRLDGGRAFSAAMGARQTPIISVAALLLLLSQSLTTGSAVGFAWSIIVLLFQRREEVPTRDEVTDVDNIRFGTWLFSLLLSIAILSPFPGNSGII